MASMFVFFLLSFLLKLPVLFFDWILLAEPCLIRFPPAAPFLSTISLSVGECMLLTLKLDMELDRFKFDEIPNELGYGFKMSRSSPGKQFSIIIASKQLTNNSAVSLGADYKKNNSHVHYLKVMYY